MIVKFCPDAAAGARLTTAVPESTSEPTDACWPPRFNVELFTVRGPLRVRFFWRVKLAPVNRSRGMVTASLPWWERLAPESMKSVASW